MDFETVDKSVDDCGKSPWRCGWCWPVYDRPQGFHGFSTGLWGWCLVGETASPRGVGVCASCVDGGGMRV